MTLTVRPALVWTLVLCLTAAAILGACIGAAIGAKHQSGVDAHADITVLPCAAWADNVRPTIPPYTFTGACVAPDGTLAFASN